VRLIYLLGDTRGRVRLHVEYVCFKNRLKVMKTLSPDTAPEIERLQMAILRTLPVSRKFALMASMNRVLSTLALHGLRASDPQADQQEVRYRLTALQLGRDLAHRLSEAREARGYAHDQGIAMPTDPIEVILTVVAALDRVGVAYYIGGSFASGAHGVYRATAGVDMVADLRDDQIEALVRALETEFYADAEMMRDAVRHRASFNLLHLATGFKVDIFVPRDRAFDRAQFERRTLYPLRDESPSGAYIASAEDSILAKLEWYRLGNEVSDRQWTDILGMLKVQGTALDVPYLRRWADALGLADLLERALTDAGLN
jgi:hypothetical protein